MLVLFSDLFDTQIDIGFFILGFEEILYDINIIIG